MSETLNLLRSRVSTNKYDQTRGVTDEQVRELVSYATEAPSAFNIQHWRFVAVTDPEAKARLKAIAYNQQKVEDATVTFIVLGDPRAYEKLPSIIDRTVEAGLIDRAKAESSVRSATRNYEGNEQLSRDEAIRGASLAAMTLMIAAEAMGLSSGPMIGFDPARLKQEFDIPEEYVPVMLVTVGYPAPGNWPRKPRLRVDEVLSFNRGRRF